MRYTPVKPAIRKISGYWMVFVPNLVFDEASCGTWHGPFGDWRGACTAANAIASAVLRNVTAINFFPMQIGAVN